MPEAHSKAVELLKTNPRKAGAALLDLPHHENVIPFTLEALKKANKRDVKTLLEGVVEKHSLTPEKKHNMKAVALLARGFGSPKTRVFVKALIREQLETNQTATQDALVGALSHRDGKVGEGATGLLAEMYAQAEAIERQRLVGKVRTSGNEREKKIGEKKVRQPHAQNPARLPVLFRFLEKEEDAKIERNITDAITGNTIDWRGEEEKHLTTLKHIIGAFASQQVKVMDVALAALRKTNATTKGRELLKKALKHENDWTRAGTVRALAALGEYGELPGMLRDESGNVRLQTAEELTSNKALGAFEEEEEREKVRTAIAYALHEETARKKPRTKIIEALAEANDNFAEYGQGHYA